MMVIKIKIYISINEKFFINSLDYFIQKINKYNASEIIAGFEVYLELSKLKQNEYLSKFIKFCNENNYILQFHGLSSYDLNTQYEYLNLINDISKKLGYRINVVLHPIIQTTKEQSLSETNLYFSSILNYIYINKLNLNISIENLTSQNKTHSLSKESLIQILANNIDLNFTYDIGHEIFEYGLITNLDSILKKRLTNVHIHTFEYNYDHLPIIRNSKNKEKWLKGILYLKKINYHGPIVLEYDFYNFGDEYDERLSNFIKSAKFIKDYLK